MAGIDYEDLADKIDDLVAAIPDSTQEDVIDALTSAAIISEEDAGELKDLI